MIHSLLAYVGTNSWLGQPTSRILTAVFGGPVGTIVPMLVGNYRTRKAIKNLVRGQLKYIERKALEFGNGDINAQEFMAGEPLYKSLYETFGFLS